MSSTNLPQLTDPKAPVTAAEGLYLRLLAGTKHAAKKRTLERIWGALEALRAEAERKKRPRTYTQSDVLKHLKQVGTPIGASTIQNPGQGDDFRALISLYSEQHGSQRDEVDSKNDDWLPLHINDPAIQHRLRVILHQNRTLRDRNIVLHKHYQRLVDEASERALPAPAQSPLLPISDAREAAAVCHFLTTTLPYHRWIIDEASGAVLDSHGDEVAPPGFIQALRRITRA